MYLVKEKVLKHYGTKRRSGRYPWGSGDNAYQRSGDFLSRIEDLEKKGWTEKQICEDLGMNTSQLRIQRTMAVSERKSFKYAEAKALREKGNSLNAIAEKMGYNNDSSVRAILDENAEARRKKARKTADFLKEQVKEKGFIDVGAGVERELAISRQKLQEALYILEMDGYEIHGFGVKQLTNPGQQTNMQVLCPPGTPHKDVYNLENIKTVSDYASHDDGETFTKLKYPKSMDPSRLSIRYAEAGGVDKDGLVEVRRGVEDLSLGNSSYAQVRILVGENRYIKGMAVYSDDLPDGKDIVFNTNKAAGLPMDKVLKKITDDPTNPFGSLIKANGQSEYIDKTGKVQQSLINKRAEEGDWNDWSDKLPSQFLAKQKKELMQKQLNLSFADKQSEYDDIMALTNPTVKKKMLKTFSDECDSAAVHLHAASLPRQKYHVILPITTLGDKEVYAPNYKNGETVALVRFPHGGTFEIPILTVNNKHADSKKTIGENALDAVGINSKVAARLSGADFDGDTVMVIPTNGKVKIHSTPQLPGLEGFDAKMEYPKTEGMKVMKNTQNEMGRISNLITDMTLKGASNSELAHAVKHSMVVIDAEKHSLDYKRSESENHIATLRKRYLGRYDEDGRYSEGASTLISKASSQKEVLKRVGSPKINMPDKAWYDPSRPEGALLWTSAVQEYKELRKVKDKATKEFVKDPITGKILKEETGRIKVRTQKSSHMAETDDAHSLSSGFPQEVVYADYANKLKALANQSRKDYVTAGKIKYDASAKATYNTEVDSLTAKLNISLLNAPRERQAQTLAGAKMKAKIEANPDMSDKEIKKHNQMELEAARISVGAKRRPIPITEREWEAIQAGAVTENKLTQILDHADIDKVRQYATPAKSSSLSAAKINKIEVMTLSGYSTADIAASLGVSSSTVVKYLKGKG